MTALAVPGAVRDTRPSLTAVTRVELRKMRDTRAGTWLLLGTVAVSVLVAVLQATAGHDRDTRSLADVFSGVLQAGNALLPVVGIMLVTAEWSQRTGLVTFTLVPDRNRVVLAKAAAAVGLGVAFWAVDLLLAVAAEAATGAHRWSMPAGLVVQTLVFAVIWMLAGIGFGAAFLNTPAAITMSFVVPIASTAFFAWGAVAAGKPWLDQSTASQPIAKHVLHGVEYGHAASALALWIVLPCVVGWFRIRRADVR